MCCSSLPAEAHPLLICKYTLKTPKTFRQCLTAQGAFLLTQAIAERAGLQLSPAAQQPQENVASNVVLAPNQVLTGAAAADRFQLDQKAGGTLAGVAARGISSTKREWCLLSDLKFAVALMQVPDAGSQGLTGRWCHPSQS